MDIQLKSTSLVIPFTPYLDTITPVRTIGELNRVFGVAVNNYGYVIVSECEGHCVTVLDSEGKKVISFGRGGGSDNVKFSSPRWCSHYSRQPHPCNWMNTRST